MSIFVYTSHDAILGYTVKTANDLFEVWLTSLHEKKAEKINSSPSQTAIQFLHRARDPVFTTDDLKFKERFLVFTHQNSKIITWRFVSNNSFENFQILVYTKLNCQSQLMTNGYLFNASNRCCVKLKL